MLAKNTTAEESAILNQTGRGTPMGEFLRRHWWPIGISADLKDKPTLVRLLGENLVLFRDGSGRPGLLDSKCPHRGANLCLGNSRENGIQCRYHGWLINHEGTVLSTPGEPDQSFKKTVRQPAYAVEELGGLVFAYMGPSPVPALPRFNFLAAPGDRRVKVTGFADCHWLPTLENGIDPIHLSFTHSPSVPGLRNPPEVWFEEIDWGVAYFSSRKIPDGAGNHVRIHNLLLPGMSATGAVEPFITKAVTKATGSLDIPMSARWAVPIDDEHTMLVRIMYKPASHPGEWRDDIPEEMRWDKPWQAMTVEPYQEYRQSPEQPVTLGYTIPPGVTPEDATICGSIGRQVDHSKEHLLPTGDIGTHLLRQIYLDGVADVANGRDPKGVVRNPDHAIIHPLIGERFIDDTELTHMRRQGSVAANLGVRT